MGKLKQDKDGKLIEVEEVSEDQDQEFHDDFTGLEVTKVTEVTKKTEISREEYLKEVYRTQPEYLRPTNRR